MIRKVSLLSLGLALALGAGRPLAAQDDRPPAHISVNTGLFQFKLAGDGYAPMVAVRAATPIASVLMIEGALLAARPGQQFATTTLLIPEAQLQIVLPFNAVVPYMGLGVGAAVDLRDSDAGGLQTDVTISGSLGMKSWISETLGIQGEYRGRGVDSGFTGSASEYTLGLIWRL